jgi:hypothetical protein
VREGQEETRERTEIGSEGGGLNEVLLYRERVGIYTTTRTCGGRVIQAGVV